MEEALTCSGTLSIDEAAWPLWDVIVIGAGPAGAIAARELARCGAATLLVERQAFPRDKVCGGSLNGRALATLQELHLSHVLPAAQAAPLSQFVVQARNRRVVLDLPVGVAVNRSAFDEQLVRSAICAGAAFLPETTALVEADSPSASYCRGVSLTHHGQQTKTAKAQVVLAADGLGHGCLRQIDTFSNRTRGDARIGLGLVLSGHDAYRGGAIHMAIGRAGYVGLVRTADEKLNVAAAVDPEALRAADTPSAVINQILQDASLPALSCDATQTWRGTLPLSRTTPRLTGGRVFLLGDAAGYVEPFTGEGMGWAIASAISVVPYVMRLLERWNDASALQWEVTQQRQMARSQIACRVLARLLRRPAAVGLALSVLNAVPSLAGPVVRRIHSGPAHFQASLT